MDGSEEVQVACSVSFDDGLNSEEEPCAVELAMLSSSTTGGESVGSEVGRPGVTVGLGVVGTGDGSGLGAMDGEGVGKSVGRGDGKGDG